MRRIIIILMVIMCLNFGVIVSYADVHFIENYSDEEFIELSRELILAWIEKETWDFVGGSGEDLYFELRDMYSQDSIFREAEFDLKLFTSEFTLLKKYYEDNELIVFGLLFAKFMAKPLLDVHMIGRQTHIKNMVANEKAMNVLFHKSVREIEKTKPIAHAILRETKTYGKWYNKLMK